MEVTCNSCKIVLIVAIVTVVVNHALYKAKVIKLFRSNKKKIILYVASMISNNLRAFPTFRRELINKKRVHFKTIREFEC